MADEVAGGGAVQWGRYATQRPHWDMKKQAEAFGLATEDDQEGKDEDAEDAGGEELVGAEGLERDLRIARAKAKAKAEAKAKREAKAKNRATASKSANLFKSGAQAKTKAKPQKSLASSSTVKSLG